MLRAMISPPVGTRQSRRASAGASVVLGLQRNSGCTDCAARPSGITRETRIAGTNRVSAFRGKFRKLILSRPQKEIDRPAFFERHSMSQSAIRNLIVLLF